MRIKEWYRDRIAELKLMRQKPYDYQKITFQTMISWVIIMMNVVLFYLGKELLLQASIATILLFVAAGVLELLRRSFLKQEDNINIKLKNNYDILLGRKTADKVLEENL